MNKLQLNNIDNYDNKLIKAFIDGMIAIVRGELNNVGSEFVIILIDYIIKILLTIFIVILKLKFILKIIKI